MEYHFLDEDGAWYTVTFSYSALVDDLNPVNEHVQRVSGRVLGQMEGGETDTDKVGDLYLYWLQLPGSCCHSLAL